MSDKLEIRITGTNQSSAAFQQVTRDAQAMGTSVEQAGTRASRALQSIKDNAAAIGAAAGTAVTISSQLGQAYIAQEQQIRAVGRAYGDSADQLLDYADEIQRTTVFSDDAARQAAIYSSSLIQNYGLQADQIKQLISVSADLAAVNVTAQGTQIGLTDAVSRTSAAIRGEAEAGELLGLSMSDTFLKAESARRGIEGWSTSMTEAEKAQFRFMILMEQSTYAMGAAAEQASTGAGKAQQLKNQIQDLTQSVGGALGPLGEYSAVLGDIALVAPLAGAGIAKMLIAMGGLGLLNPALLPAIAAGGTGALLYQSVADPYGDNYGNQFFGGALSYGGSALNALLPGSPGDIFKQISDERGNVIDLVQAVEQLFYTDPGVQINDPDKYAIGRLRTAGIIPWGWEGSTNDAGNYISGEAARMNLTEAQYIAMMMPNATAYRYDAISGQYVYADDMVTLEGSRRFAAGGGYSGYVSGTSGAGLGYVPTPGDPAARHQFSGRRYEFGDTPELTEAAATYRAGGMGAIANSGLQYGTAPVQLSPGMDMAAQATAAQQLTDALIAQYPAYAGVIEGMNSYHDAAQAFRATQDGLIQESAAYGARQSEFVGVLGDMEAGYEILQQRQAEGIELSAREQEFMANYASGVENVTKGIEQYTIEQALLAGQYAQNIEIQGQMIAAHEGTNDVVGRLVDVLSLYILTLNGVPDEVATQIYLNNIEYAISSVATFASFLNGLPNRKDVAVYYQTYGDYVPGSVGGITLHGGVVGYRDGGTVIRAAEAGPELMSFRNGGQAMAMVDGLYQVPRGTYVTPAPASRGKLAGGGGGITINGPITIVANDPRQFYDGLAEYARGGSRL